jgi:hypothetical protein
MPLAVWDLALINTDCVRSRPPYELRKIEHEDQLNGMEVIKANVGFDFIFRASAILLRCMSCFTKQKLF